MKIREATKRDYDQIWEIFRRVIETEDTYVFRADTPKKDLEKLWFADYMASYVVEKDGSIIGSYVLKPNHVDLGSHVANGSYMVHPNFRGEGIGKLMCAHSIEMAREKGYQSIQFNIVVSSNTGAVKLWQKFGFEIIGTTPKGFRHKKLGLIDTYIMHKTL